MGFIRSLGLSISTDGAPEEISKQTLQEVHERRKAFATQANIDDWYFVNWGARAVCAVSYFFLKLSGKNLVDGMDAYRREWIVKKEGLVRLLEEDTALRLATGGIWGLG